MALLLTVARKLREDLGYGKPLFAIFSSIAFTVCLFFYLYAIGSFFATTVYPLINRVVFIVPFQEHVINEHLDYIIIIVATTCWFLFSVKNRAIRYYLSLAYFSTGIILAFASPNNIIFDVLTLLSLPITISIALYYHKAQKSGLNFYAKLTLRYISLFATTISTIGIAFLVLSIFVYPDSKSSAGYIPTNELSLLLSSFSTIYIVLLVFCLPVKILFKEALRMLKLDVKEDIYQAIYSNYEQNKLKTQTKIGFLLVAMILSVVLVLIPQHPSINKDNQDIGVDTSYYVTWIGGLAKSKNVSDFIYQAFIEQGRDGDRPLSLIFIFLIYQVAGVGGNNLSEVIEHLPMILGPGLVLAFYLLTLELTRNEKIALIAAFFGAVSLHTLVGIYAGFYANWLALIVGYISVVFLFRYLQSGHLHNVVIFSILLVGVLLFHVYTWTVLAAVAAVFLVAMLVIKLKKSNSSNNNYFTKRRIIWLLVAILLSTMVDVTKVLSTGSSGGVEQDIEVAQTGLGIQQFNVRWQILNVTMNESMGGAFSNFIVLILGLLWVLKSNVRDPATAFIMIFLSSGLVPLFFGSWGIQARVFYDMPFEIPAAIALYYVSSRLGSILTTLAACTWLFVISVVTVSNYHLIPVPGMH